VSRYASSAKRLAISERLARMMLIVGAPGTCSVGRVPEGRFALAPYSLVPTLNELLTSFGGQNGRIENLSSLRS
jgi:hypothetical protein